jgi:MscS family membrane protein
MDFLQNLTLYQTVGVLFAAAFIVHITTSTVLKQLITQADKTKNQLDDYLLKSISAPIKALVWFAWFYLSINALKGEVALLAQVINYIDILPISIITWGVLRMTIEAIIRILIKRAINLTESLSVLSLYSSR